MYQETQERRSNAALAMFGIRLMYVRNDDDGWEGGESKGHADREEKTITTTTIIDNSSLPDA